MIKLIVKLVFFLVMAQAYAQSGTVRIEVRTNVNKFTCSCDEESFVCKEFDANQKVLKLPVASFSCPKRMIEKDLVELFEAEKSVKAAIVMEKLNCTLNEAREKLDNAGGFLRNLID